MYPHTLTAGIMSRPSRTKSVRCTSFDNEPVEGAWTEPLEAPALLDDREFASDLRDWQRTLACEEMPNETHVSR